MWFLRPENSYVFFRQENRRNRRDNTNKTPVPHTKEPDKSMASIESPVSPVLLSKITKAVLLSKINKAN